MRMFMQIVALKYILVIKYKTITTTVCKVFLTISLVEQVYLEKITNPLVSRINDNEVYS